MEKPHLPLAKEKGYVVDEEGYVTSPRGTKLSPFPVRGGYLSFSMRIGEKSVKVPVHQLVAFQKFGEAYLVDGVQARHLDGNNQNNTWDNIDIGTATENAQDKPVEVRRRACSIAGKAGKGRARHFMRKLSFEQAEQIRKEYASGGVTQKQLAKKYNVGKGVICDLLNGRTYFKA